MSGCDELPLDWPARYLENPLAFRGIKLRHFFTTLLPTENDGWFCISEWDLIEEGA